MSEREGEENRVYGASYYRLVEIENAWDPENVFRMNQHVKPRTQPQIS